MAGSPMPSALDSQHELLANQVYRTRLVRGSCWLIVAALVAGMMFVLIDAILTLSLATRCLLQIGWLAGIGLLGWRFLEQARAPHLSWPVENLDRGPPAQSLSWLGLGTLLAILAVIASLWIPGIGARYHRVVFPWYRPSQLFTYEVVVASGDPVVRRGQPVTLSAYLKPIDTTATLPQAAEIVYRNSSGKEETRLAMIADPDAAFHITRPEVTQDFEYRIIVGPVISRWHAVVVADPVELTEHTSVEITPPAYSGRPTRITNDITELVDLQYAQAVLKFNFTRPPDTVFLTWRPEGGMQPHREPVAVQLSPGGMAGTASVPLAQNGTLHLVMINESGPRKLRTEKTIPVRVTLDQPPKLEQVTGITPRPVSVRPNEQIPIHLTITDDLKITTVELEYAVASSPSVVRIPLPLAGIGSTRAEGQFTWDLQGKGRHGDIIRCRLRITDNRRIVEPDLPGHEIFYPPEGWAVLRLSESAPPRDQQEIFGLRDSVQGALIPVLQRLRIVVRDTTTLKVDTAGCSPLPIDHGVRIARIREQIDLAAEALRGVASDISLTPEVHTIAVAIRDVAERILRDADGQIRKAITDDAADRQTFLLSGCHFLSQAVSQLEQLLNWNKRLAQNRLDRDRLRTLARDQTALLNQVDTAPEDLRKTQEQLLERLRELIAGSESLGTGKAAATRDVVKQLAADATAMAHRVQQLDKAIVESTRATRLDLLNQIAVAQRDITETSIEPLTTAIIAARLARLELPRPEEFERIAAFLANDQVIEALVEFQNLSRRLDEAAQVFESLARERIDPKHVSRQLSAWQSDLKERVATATRETPFAQLPEGTRIAFRTEQKAILATVRHLNLPQAPEVTKCRFAAIRAVEQVLVSLAGDGTGTADAMKAAADGLLTLAEKTPTVTARLAQARVELFQMRTEQESIITLAEQTLRMFERQPLTPALFQTLATRLSDLRDKELRLLTRVAALDLPGMNQRQEQTLASLRLAASDLAAGALLDIPASLHAVRRDIDRLKQSIDNQLPADSRADSLALKQTEVWVALRALGDTTSLKLLEPHAAAQAQILRQLEPFHVPEAPGLLKEALDAVRLADTGFRDGSGAAELQRRVKAAADALTRLAERVAGVESDRDRVLRLANYRRLAGIEARKIAGKPFNPKASDEARQVLGWEVEELIMTRVGIGQQAAKRSVLDLYIRLREQTEPDRQAGSQKQLADALDDLAAKMAGDVVLTSGRPRLITSREPLPADDYLPSFKLAGQLRELAYFQRKLRDETNRASTEVNRLTRPASINTLGILERRQRTLQTEAIQLSAMVSQDPRATALLEVAVEHAGQLTEFLKYGQLRRASETAQRAVLILQELAAVAGDRPWRQAATRLFTTQAEILDELTPAIDNRPLISAQQAASITELASDTHGVALHFEQLLLITPADHISHAALSDSARQIHTAAKLLSESTRKFTDGFPTDAEKLRGEAISLLNKAAEKTLTAGEAILPPASNKLDPQTQAVGLAVRQAEIALMLSIRSLGSNVDLDQARRAMSTTAVCLNKAVDALFDQRGVSDRGVGPAP